MGLAPVSRLSKKDIIYLANNRCKHSHTYLNHYQCYLKENPHNEKTGVFDIECSNLAANFGIIFCYAILHLETGKVSTRTITKKELSKELDKNLVRQCVEDLKKYTRVITYYGTGFDIPFVRTRALRWGIPFIPYGELNHKDLYYVVKRKLRLHKRSLEVACNTVLGRTQKTRFDPEYWTRALQGDRRSLDYITNHCIYDVKDTADLAVALEPFTITRSTSI